MTSYQKFIIFILVVILVLTTLGLLGMLSAVLVTNNQQFTKQNLNPTTSVSLPTQQSTSTSLPRATVTQKPQLMPTLSLTGNYNKLNTLIRNVVGRRLKDLVIDPYEAKGVNGYDIELVVSTITKTRLETLQMAYVLLHEIFYNFPSNDGQSIILSIRPFQDTDCVIGMGLGDLAVYEFLPQTPPDNFERWFQKLVSSQYYGDLPGQTDLRLAYANDHTSFSRCSLFSLK